MNTIEFSPEQKDAMVEKLKKYFSRELNQEIEQFDAEFLIDFFSTEFGGHYYNRGLEDAKIAVRSKLDDLEQEIDSLEKQAS